MSTYLFLFTIGPVQSFIAQARKTQDLYAGSQILSVLIKAAIGAFKKEFPNGEIKFPILDDTLQNPSLPNRFIGKMQGVDDELKGKAQNIQTTVENKWEEIALDVLRKATPDKPAGFTDQIKAHLDIHWAFQLITSNYAGAYQTLESLGGAIKNVRQFSQYDYDGFGEVGRKCSIDGINNALFYRKNGNNKSAYLERAYELERFVLNPGEGLSAISLVKRFYLEGRNREAFPSTAEVALMDDEKKLPPKAKEILDCYKKLFKKEKLPEACITMFTNGWIEKARIINPKENQQWNDQFDDYQMLFEENLNHKTLPDPTQLELARHLHTRLKPWFKTKYYALVLFDGDRMGKWLSGEYNNTKDNLEDFHKVLSGALSKFSSEARDYLNRENGNGHTIYTGGDDFLGFINLHHLFPVMKHLREAFDAVVNQAIKDFKKPDKHLTFSAGILIAHYKIPFSEVLKKARRIEESSKNEGDRNAFGISVIKHSGEVQEAVFKWGNKQNSPSNCDNWNALAHIVAELDNDVGHFSNKFIQNLTKEFFQLTGADLHDLDTQNRDTEYLGKALMWEIQRLIDRSLDKEENPQKDKNYKDDLCEAVKILWENTPPTGKIRHFIHALQIADFITRKTTQDK